MRIERFSCPLFFDTAMGKWRIKLENGLGFILREKKKKYILLEKQPVDKGSPTEEPNIDYSDHSGGPLAVRGTIDVDAIYNRQEDEVATLLMAMLIQ